MKKAFTLIAVLFFLIILPSSGVSSSLPDKVPAEDNSNPSEKYYARVWDSIDGETKRLLASIGVSADGISLEEMTPSAIIKTVFSVFSEALSDIVSDMFKVLTVMLTVTVILSFGIKNESIRLLAECTGNACILFSLLAVTGEATKSATAAVKLTEAFILSVMPPFVGVISMSGSPSLALGFGTVTMTFAQVTSGAFSTLLPTYSSSVTAISAAGVINPFFACEKITGMLNKIATGLSVFACTVFSAVLSVGGILSGSVDSVAAKGLKFLIGSCVPIVGSTVGDALGSVKASLGLIKSSLAVVFLAAVAFIALPCLVRLTVFRLSFGVLKLSADILSLNRISGFIDALNGLFTFCTATLCLNVFVFIIGTAIVLSVGK